MCIPFRSTHCVTNPGVLAAYAQKIKLPNKLGWATSGYKVFAWGHLAETVKTEDAPMCCARAHSHKFISEGINDENLA